MNRLLVIEDEPAMRRGLEDLLASAGYRVLLAADGKSGLEAVQREKPDLVVLDVMLPGLDGFSLVKELRRLRLDLPVLLLTAKGHIRDRITGLDAGADDYLSKPFSPEELLARVRALLRRVERGNKRPETLVLDDLVVDFTRLEARRSGRKIHLTPREFDILRLLAGAHGGAVSRETFLDVVWGYGAFPTTRTVDSHIAQLRQKIEKDPAQPRHLRTVHGVGYRLSTPATDEH